MNILVIEDDAVVAETLALYLRQEGFQVLLARDGNAGLQLAMTDDVGLIVLDLMVPGMNGVDICRHVRKVRTVPILMLTARVSEEDRLAGFDAGADDYVPKPFSPREIVARVRALLRRAGTALPAPPAPVVVGDLEVDLWTRQVRVGGCMVALTATELRILAALARHPGRVFTRDELIERVFGPVYEGLDRTVDVHITHLRKKIEPGPEPRYVLTVHGIGYRLATADDL